MSMNSVGISGIGLLSPWGNDLQTFKANYLAGTNAFSPMERFDTQHVSAKAAAQIRDFDPKKFIKPNKVGRYDIFSRLGIAVAKMSLESCAQPLTEEQLTNMGIVMTCETQSSVTAEYLKDLIQTGPRTVSPKTFALVSANSSNCNVGIETGIKGPSINVSAKFGSGFLAIFTSMQMMHSEHISQCLVGSLDYLSQVVMDAYSKLKGYETATNKGFKPGEGAAALVLSNTDATYGKIIGISYGCSIADNYRWPHDSHTHARILKQAIGEHKVDRVQVATNGVETVDKMEQDALNILFSNSEHKPELIRIKGLIGEFSAVSLMQVTAACCEPKGTKTLISITSPGGMHGALFVESSGFLSEQYREVAG